jgi:hypothetical protein
MNKIIVVTTILGFVLYYRKLPLSHCFGLQKYLAHSYYLSILNTRISRFTRFMVSTNHCVQVALHASCQND